MSTHRLLNLAIALTYSIVVVVVLLDVFVWRP